jgi:aspartokinase-like uncharacterized kinase
MTVVFKLGGSLLTLPGLADALRTVLEHRAGRQCLIVPGGGTVADVVREWSRVHNLDDETSHWLAVSSLELNRQFLDKLLGWNSVSSRAMADRLWNRDLSPLLLDMTGFLRAEETDPSDSLPHDWSVTSDSLAAWAALCWPAEELILLKSVPVPRDLTADEASRSQLVDSYFPKIARRLRRISWCNLRAATMDVEPWLVHSAEVERTTRP